MKKKLLKTASVLLALTVFLLLFAGCQTTTVVDEWISDEGTFTLATTAAPTAAKTKATTKPTTRKTAKTTAKKTTTAPTTAATTVNAKEYVAYEFLKNAIDKMEALNGINMFYRVQGSPKSKDENSDNSNSQVLGIDYHCRFDHSQQRKEHLLEDGRTIAYSKTRFREAYKLDDWVYVPFGAGMGVKYKLEKEDPEDPLKDFLKLPPKKYLEGVSIEKNRTGTKVISFSVAKTDVETLYAASIKRMKEYIQNSRAVFRGQTVGDAQAEYEIDPSGYITRVSISIDMNFELTITPRRLIGDAYSGEYEDLEPVDEEKDVVIDYSWEFENPGEAVVMTLPDGWENFEVLE